MDGMAHILVASMARPHIVVAMIACHDTLAGCRQKCMPTGVTSWLPEQGAPHILAGRMARPHILAASIARPHVVAVRAVCLIMPIQLHGTRRCKSAWQHPKSKLYESKNMSTHPHSFNILDSNAGNSKAIGVLCTPIGRRCAPLFPHFPGFSTPII
jgi:hypothetical protein